MPSMEQPDSTPVFSGVEGAEAGTPQSEPGRVRDSATSDSTPAQRDRTQVAGQPRPTPSEESPTPSAEEPQSETLGQVQGDGTTGATPPRDESTPSGDVNSEAVTVTSCEPENVPEFTGGSDAFVVVENVNFRSGPGTDCSLVGEDVLESGLEITVTSDPVVREGDDSEWVRVEVGGEEGWVATEFIEPDQE